MSDITELGITALDITALGTVAREVVARGPRQVPETPDLSAVVDTAGLDAVTWAIAAAIFVGGYALSVVVRRLIVRVLRRGMSSASFAEVLVGRLVQTFMVSVALVTALSVLGVQFAPLIGALGIGGIAVALALQPTLHNLFSGLVLHAQRPVRLGDEVITGDVQGEVIDITSRAVVIRTPAGEIVHIPNSVVLDREIHNLVRHGSRRSTIVVGVAYGTDLEHARTVLLAAATDADGVLTDPAPRILASEFAASSIDFTIDVWHGPTDSERRMARDAVVRRVHPALGAAGITIPFPQHTLWWGETQGSSAAERSRDGAGADTGRLRGTDDLA